VLEERKKPAEKGEKSSAAQRGLDKRTPRAAMSLITSVEGSDLHALKGLIAGGADVNAVDEEGRTALWYAAREGHVECATALLDAKADVNKADSNGDTPLHEAFYSGLAECVRVRRLFGFGGGHLNAADALLFIAAPPSAQGHRERFKHVWKFTAVLCIHRWALGMRTGSSSPRLVFLSTCY
jgi:ankyrin repeat protein